MNVEYFATQSKWFCKNQSARAFFFFGLTHERTLNERTKAFFIPHVMLFVAPDELHQKRYKLFRRNEA